jgi:hypothetical protein
MRAASLSSSAIDGIAYDEEQRTLSIWFRDSGRYLYSEVPRAVYDALRTSASAGRYFCEAVKGRYRCTVDPARRRFHPDA